MIDSDHYIGQVLDEKYRLERLLGRGGMGAVYLATHLGTERYVALKLITPQFMRNEEFVARFKREARAAGRLRHPNVVDVTDFGFAHARGEPVAYLVMEYLDGCTLGDVLTEEKRLPLEWVVDILEQVCSAVHEAHQQGIVHRDLKPDNIWLEPNRLGGYRVKVLDFGIAKLAEPDAPAINLASPSVPAQATSRTPAAHAIAGSSSKGPPAESRPEGRGLESEGHDLEIATLVYPLEQNAEAVTQLNANGVTEPPQSMEEDRTQLFARFPHRDDAASTTAPLRSTQAADGGDGEGDRTLMLSQATRRDALGKQTALPASTVPGNELTRVGAIMGTPLYMSPEQCAAKSLDARSDIYSLGVIAYQMLAGEPPFAGETGSVMREHINLSPPPLRERNKKVPKRAAEVVMAALSKKPEDRPPTAAAFASSLRAQAEGVGSLYRRAFALYSEYFPKFLRLSLIAHLPVIVVTFLMIGLTVAEDSLTHRSTATKVVFLVALALLALLQGAGFFVAAHAISGMTAVIVTQLTAAPLRPVELRTSFAVLKQRWRPFLKTSISVTLRIIIGFLLLFIPGLIVSFRYALYAPVVLMEGLEKKVAMRRARELASRSRRTVIIVVLLQFLIPFTFIVLLGRIGVTGSRQNGLHVTDRSMGHQIYQELSGLINIVIVPLMSIVPALLYLKMRQLGGETLGEALAKIEEVDTNQSAWRQRMRTRLSLHTPRANTPGSRP